MPRFETVIKVTHVEPNNIYPNSKESITVECKDHDFKESYSYKLSEGPEGRRMFVESMLTKLAAKVSKNY